MPMPRNAADEDHAAFARYLRTVRRPAPLELKYNHSHDPDTGRFTFAEAGGGRADAPAAHEKAGAGTSPGARPRTSAATSGSGGTARLTPAAKAFADRIDRDLFLRTGKHIHVNSGTRNAEAQAEAMVEKGPKTWNIYKDKKALAEISTAYERSRRAGAGRRDQEIAIAKVIRKQMSQGRYISNHLVSGAIDLRIKGYSSSEEELMKQLSRKHGATKVLHEGGRVRHLHVQF